MDCFDYHCDQKYDIIHRSCTLHDKPSCKNTKGSQKPVKPRKATRICWIVCWLVCRFMCFFVCLLVRVSWRARNAQHRLRFEEEQVISLQFIGSQQEESMCRRKKQKQVDDGHQLLLDGWTGCVVLVGWRWLALSFIVPDLSFSMTIRAEFNDWHCL